MKQIRVAILGQGRSGRDIHSSHLSQDTEKYQIVAIVDPLEERRERAKRERACATYADYTELFGRDDIDLVVNAAPSKFHVPYTLALMEAGFNVLCEKPFASKAADVDKMIATSERTGKLLAVFQQSRFAPYFQQVRKVIDSGVLGAIIQVNIAFNGFSRRYDWQTLTSEMGGNLLNTGPHPLDQALQLFGTDATPQVTCIMRNVLSYGTAEDHVLLLLQGENRPIVHLEISSCSRFPLFIYNVYGTQGGLKGDSKRLEWEWYDPASAPELKLITAPLCKSDGTPSYCTDSLTWQKDEWEPEAKTGLFETMSKAFYDNLYLTLTEGKPLVITPQQVRQQIAVIEECQRQNPHIYGG